MDTPITFAALLEKWQDESPNDWGNKLYTRAQCADEAQPIYDGLLALSAAAEYAILGCPEEVKLRDFVEQLDAILGQPATADKPKEKL